ncbi:Vps54-domain-containing protein [Guyanagaster necrorhizus]|uniref:Vacuolar protein sorting-associated protein 54 n=1 Tax=Guyanagaster necrorhizus TaxID=856835 RepID=A0A9P7VXK1_9AGAR|nr:Vps54-domain-containing protein [Guyanagaster necrorhizus MCA 3950]KAG7448049.1 Vps54-domain-containing protein [Guyanagaster necrorhizus MCA 3950]
MSDSNTSSVSRPTSPRTALPDTVRQYRFNWDPASRQPGPESVSGTTTDGRGPDYFNTIPRLGHLNLNSSTATLSFGALPAEWSSSKHGFHAISTVLNNPHKQQAPPKAHSALPAVPPAELPRVRRKDFDPYLCAISSEWERFENAHQPEAGPSTPRPPFSRASSYPTNAKSFPSLDSVPAVFFESNFNLADPGTFATVTEQDGQDPDVDPTALAHSLPLLDKFSHYADTIELHLTHEISLRSSSFFAALSNLHHLQSESSSCLSQISRLRELLQDVDNDMAKKGLEVVEMEKEKSNLKKINDGIEGIKGIVEVSAMARQLISEGQWGDALDIVDDLERTWAAEETHLEKNDVSKSVPLTPVNGRLSPLPATPEETLEAPETPEMLPGKPLSNRQSLAIPLASLQAFSALPGHLRSLTMEIVSSLSNDFSSTLREDLLGRIDVNEGGSPRQMNEALKDRLSLLLEGLVRTKGLRQATSSWRNGALSEDFSAIGGESDTALTSDRRPRNGSEPRAGLGNHLREMTHLDFMKILHATFKSLLRAIEGLQTQGTVIGEVLEAIYKLKYQSSPDPSVQSDLIDILGSVTELAHVMVAKVISIRSEPHTSLPLHEFWEFFNETWSFVIGCEVICRRMVVGLRGVVVGQGKAFLQAFHQTRLTQSAKLVEDEQWNPCDVPLPLQHLADLLVDSAVKDSPELVIQPPQPESTPASPSKSAANGIKSFFSSSPMKTLVASSSSSSFLAGGSHKHLHIEDRAYFTVYATSEVLYLLLDYVKVIVNFGMLVTDTMSRVIEFLKAFNSRTCQVVLGAGAMRSAGLKNITAKHLALASQSLSIMIALIPYVRETFRRHLSSKQAVMLVVFDKLKRDYQEHQNEIHAKLIAIMGERLSAHIKSLRALDWSTLKEGGGANEYIVVLTKETVTLHKVLSRYLSTNVVQDVMTQVFAAVNHRLSEEYTKLELPHAAAKTRLLADARHFYQKIAELKNVGVPSNMLEVVISEKSLPRPTVPSTPARSDSLAVNSAAWGSSTNLRLKGLLSGRGSSFDKVPPIPTSASTPPPSNEINGTNKSGINGRELPLPPPPIQEEGAGGDPPSSGFKQIEVCEPGASESAGPQSGPQQEDEGGQVSTPPTQSPPSEAPSEATTSSEEIRTMATSVPSEGQGPSPPTLDGPSDSSLSKDDVPAEIIQNPRVDGSIPPASASEAVHSAS